MSAPRRRARALLILTTVLALSWALWATNTRPALTRSRTIPMTTKEYRP